MRDDDARTVRLWKEMLVPRYRERPDALLHSAFGLVQ